LVTTVVVSVTMLDAKPVTPDEAKKVADRFENLYHTGQDLVPGEVVSYALENGSIAYHVVKMKPTGWIMVSGDDLLTPVIGYSFTHAFVPMDQWGESATAWFDKLDRHIGDILKKPGLPVSDEWESMFTPGYTKSTTGTVVEPFIPVEWNQGSGWNRFCPDDPDGPGDHAYVGCVAVCMAQAMSVYEYPVNPSGEHSYIHPDYGTQYVNYDNQSYNWGAMSHTSSDDENAKLLYHLAVSVDMDFGADGSGSYTSRIPGALKKYFNYSESIKYYSRSGFSDADWKQKLIDELIQGRPVIYSGDGNNDQAGHAFNIDGVGAGGNYFHLNWGWSGSYNGYFTLDALNPGSNNFSYDQAAVIGIKPPSAGPYDLELSSLSVYEKQPVGTFVAKVSVADEFEGNEYTYELKGRFNVFLEDYGPADFYIENDSLKTDKVFDREQHTTEPLIITVTDTLGNFYTEEFEIQIKKFYYGPTEVSLTDTTVEERKSPGYYVGSIEIGDDIANNEYSYSFVGGYNQGNLTENDCFYVEGDSLFTNQTFYMSEGLVYYMEMAITDAHDHLLKKMFEIVVTENISGSSETGEPQSVPEFGIYPNPAGNYFTVNFDGSLVRQASLQVYSVSGKRVLDVPVHPGQMVDISKMRNGMYVIVVSDGSASSRTKLVIYK